MNGRTIAENMEREHQRQSLRDHFAAAALTGLVASKADLDDTMQDVCEQAYSWADAMLRERDKTSVGVSATGAESGSTPDAQGFGRSNECPCQPFDSAPTTDQERFVRFQSAVMNWISEATGFFHDDVLRTDDARDVITNACMRCWDAFDRISYPSTNLDAAPAARASLPTADHAVCRGRESGCGTGGTNRSVEESSRPRRAHNPEIAGANPAAPTDDAATGEPGGGVGLPVPESQGGKRGALMNAVQRGVEMMHIKMGELPSLAVDFLRHLASKVGMCGEVCLTAFAVYAQCVEGLPCDDDLYAARPEDREWFAERVGAR